MRFIKIAVVAAVAVSILMQLGDVAVQAAVERMSPHRGGIADNHELHAGACHGYIHAAQVAQESYLSGLVGTYKGDYHHVALAALEPVYGVDCNEITE